MHEQQFNGVAVTPDRAWTEAFLNLQVVFEKGDHNLAEAAVH
jgi:hypothetical protein